MSCNPTSRLYCKQCGGRINKDLPGHRNADVLCAECVESTLHMLETPVFGITDEDVALKQLERAGTESPAKAQAIIKEYHEKQRRQEKQKHRNDLNRYKRKATLEARDRLKKEEELDKRIKEILMKNSKKKPKQLDAPLYEDLDFDLVEDEGHNSIASQPRPTESIQDAAITKLISDSSKIAKRLETLDASQAELIKKMDALTAETEDSPTEITLTNRIDELVESTQSQTVSIRAYTSIIDDVSSRLKTIETAPQPDIEAMIKECVADQAQTIIAASTDKAQRIEINQLKSKVRVLNMQVECLLSRSEPARLPLILRPFIALKQAIKGAIRHQLVQLHYYTSKLNKALDTLLFDKYKAD